MDYHELGRFPLKYNRLFRIIKYWYKLLDTKNTILKAAYHVLLTDSHSLNNWTRYVKDNLFSLGFGDVWINQGVTPAKIMPPLI